MLGLAEASFAIVSWFSLPSDHSFLSASLTFQVVLLREHASIYLLHANLRVLGLFLGNWI